MAARASRRRRGRRAATAPPRTLRLRRGMRRGRSRPAEPPGPAALQADAGAIRSAFCCVAQARVAQS
eukprot:11050387-Lingulodinium_polyedra.AAC.1